MRDKIVILRFLSRAAETDDEIDVLLLSVTPNLFLYPPFQVVSYVGASHQMFSVNVGYKKNFQMLRILLSKTGPMSERMAMI